MRDKLNDFRKPTGSSLRSLVHEAVTIREGNQSSNLAQRTINSMVNSEKEVDKANIRSIVIYSLSYTLLRPCTFHTALDAVAKVGLAYEAPCSETARRNLSENLKCEVNDHVQSIRESWKSSSCKIMPGSWTNEGKRPYLNLLAAFPKGVVFMK